MLPLPHDEIAYFSASRLWAKKLTNRAKLPEEQKKLMSKSQNITFPSFWFTKIHKKLRVPLPKMLHILY